MERILPYEISYKCLEKWRFVENGFLWSLLLCPFLTVLLQKQNNEFVVRCINILSIINYISIIGYALLYIIVEILMQPMTASSRRKGFIDNSLGTKFLDQPVTNYYDNDSIKVGTYKMLVNCFENCFFTFSLVKATLSIKIFKNVIIALILIFFTYYGIKNLDVTIPILQLFLSFFFLMDLAYHVSFYFKLRSLFGRFKSIFSKKLSKKETLEQAFYMVLEYESALAYNKSSISNSKYKEMNEKLTNDWAEIKRNYNIS